MALYKRYELGENKGVKNYIGLIVIAGIFGVIVLIRVIIGMMDRKPEAASKDFEGKVYCPFCKEDLTTHIRKVARSSRQQEVPTECPSCQMKALWCVSGFPPLMVKKISRPKAVKDDDVSEYSKVSE